jgi:hypothetical protein
LHKNKLKFYLFDISAESINLDLCFGVADHEKIPSHTFDISTVFRLRAFDVEWNQSGAGPDVRRDVR